MARRAPAINRWKAVFMGEWCLRFDRRHQMVSGQLSNVSSEGTTPLPGGRIGWTESPSDGTGRPRKSEPPPVAGWDGNWAWAKNAVRERTDQASRIFIKRTRTIVRGLNCVI